MKLKTLIKLSVALAIPTLVGCADDGVHWTRAHALQDASTAMSHAVELASVGHVAPAAALADATTNPAAKATRPRRATTTTTPVSITTRDLDTDLDADLGVKRLVVARGVKSREPVSPSSAFSTGSKRIYAFVEVSNPERAESAVFVSFVREGERERGAVRLRVGESPRWRTWAYTRLADKPGRYQAMVRDGRGKLLAKTAFEVKAGVGDTAAPSEPSAEPPAVNAANSAPKSIPSADPVAPSNKQATAAISKPAAS